MAFKMKYKKGGFPFKKASDDMQKAIDEALAKNKDPKTKEKDAQSLVRIINQDYEEQQKKSGNTKKQNLKSTTI